MYRLLFNILDRTVEEGEHWKFYFLRFPKNVPSAQNKILAINQMKAGSDNITTVHNIIDGCEPEAYAFVKKYRLDDVYYKMLKAGKQGCY